MARMKKPLNETEQEATIRKTLERVANVASRSEKTSWNRKMNNMVKLLALLRPIEDKILELHAQKEPIFDEIQSLRTTMVKECVHPFEFLIHKSDHIECKFCNKRIGLPQNENNGSET